MDNKPLCTIPDSLVAENIFLSAGSKEILRGATIRADKGKITGLLGRNGSGKTTMLQAIFGTRTAQECDVFLNGRKIKQPYTINGLVNYLPQRPFLPPHLTVRKIAEQYEVKLAEAEQYFPVIAEDAGRKIADLSGGAERLHSIIMILMANTRFSLLDEPFTHVMPVHQESLAALITQQKTQKGIIITDHEYRALLDISDHICLMKDGKAIFIKDHEELVLNGYIGSLLR